MKQKSKFILFGIFTGFCNGLFGSGGGMIAVPCLEKYAKLEPKKAHATAILIILPLSVISLFGYRMHADVEPKKLGFIIWGGVVGSLIGARFLKKLSGKVLKRIFSVFILIAAVRMVIF